MLQSADDVGCDALGRVVLHQKARLAVLDDVGDSAHGSCEDGGAAGFLVKHDAIICSPALCGGTPGIG